MEREWDRAISQALSLEVPVNHPLIKLADMELLATEALQFFPPESRPMPWGELPAPIADFGTITEWDWRYARGSFIERWLQLGGTL